MNPDKKKGGGERVVGGDDTTQNRTQDKIWTIFVCKFCFPTGLFPLGLNL